MWKQYEFCVKNDKEFNSLSIREHKLFTDHWVLTFLYVALSSLESQLFFETDLTLVVSVQPP